MTRFVSNVYTTFVMFLKSFQFSPELCFLGESSFEAQSRIKILIFLSFTNEIYHYGHFFMKTFNNFFMKQIFYGTIFYAVSKKFLSFTSSTTHSTLAITILKLLRRPSESARVFGDPIYVRGRRRAKKPFPIAFKKQHFDITLSTDDSCHALKP